MIAENLERLRHQVGIIRNWNNIQSETCFSQTRFSDWNVFTFLSHLLDHIPLQRNVSQHNYQ